MRYPCSACRDRLEMALEEVPGAGPVKLMAARKEVDVEPVLRTGGAVDAAQVFVRPHHRPHRVRGVVDPALDQEWPGGDEPGHIGEVAVAEEVRQEFRATELRLADREVLETATAVANGESPEDLLVIAAWARDTENGLKLRSTPQIMLALAAAPRKTAGGTVVAPPPDKYRVEVIHGSNRNVVEF